MVVNGNEVVTAKADPALNGETVPETTPKKNRRALWIVLAVLGLCLAFGLGAIAGGGAVYGLTQARSRAQVRPTLPFGVPHLDPLPRGLPTQPDHDWRGPLPNLRAGALIVEVVPDGPAAQAGLRAGDVVVALDGEAIGVQGDLAERIAAYAPGAKVTLEVAQGHDLSSSDGREVSVTLGEHPESEGKAYLGVTYMQTPGRDFEPDEGLFWFRHFEFDDEDDRFEHRRPHFEFVWPHRGS